MALLNNKNLGKGERGYYTLYCYTCGYAVNQGKASQKFGCCPLCKKKGFNSELKVLAVVTSPKSRCYRLDKLTS